MLTEWCPFHKQFNLLLAMNIRIALVSFGLFALTACHNKREVQDTEMEKPTPTQQKLFDEGWTSTTPNEDLTEEYGIKPIYGTQDNYFDISMGKGCNVAVKIMDLKTNKCIRYVYVAENTTTTVQENPQGVYYLKLAYGYDWMEMETENGKQGKFTRNVTYERSQDTFDFGVKNSRDEINYSLDINVVDSKLENSFLTTPIDEKEFMK